jgi:amidophosphoribosyltransferase
MRRLEGAYSVVALSEGALIAFRDPHGFRPLELGRLGADWVVASETCALDLVGARWERSLEPGELVLIDAHGLRSTIVDDAEASRALCIFEYVYLARPDSDLDGVEVYGARVRMGEQLAREAPVEADLVMPIPDSGTPAAIGFARESGVPFGEGLIKNRYVGRTFIQPEQGMREQGIRLKFNPLADVADKRVVVVDDSIVRGNTMRQITAMLFAGGAREVHVRVSSPPIISPCFYGIDFGDDEQLVASSRSQQDVCELVGATSLVHLSLEGMQQAVQRPPSAVCRACFTGRYPAAVPAGRRLEKERFEEPGRVPAGLLR